MMGQDDALRDQAIWVSSSGVVPSQLKHAHETRFVVELDVSTSRSVRDVVALLAENFLFPHDAAGLDAALDLMSDLDWLDHDTGYALYVRGLDRLAITDESLLRRLVGMLPQLCDRWRTRCVPFQVVLIASVATVSVLREVLELANREIEQAATKPWLHDLKPVEVYVCDA